MGTFDTLTFDRLTPSPECRAEIRSDQTNASECTLDDYRRRQETGVRGRARLPGGLPRRAGEVVGASRRRPR